MIEDIEQVNREGVETAAAGSSDRISTKAERKKQANLKWKQKRKRAWDRQQSNGNV